MSGSTNSPPGWSMQRGFDLRVDWGPPGIERLLHEVRTIVVVDVLRFTTAVETAVSAGATVYPYRWNPSSDRLRESSAEEFAASVDAILVGRRGEGPSLSPPSLARLAPHTRLVLPSPNGATCVLHAADRGALVIAGCLRNSRAVAAWAERAPQPIGVIACGEVWTDGSLRPSLEDLVGAGAILSELPGTRSPEAESAVATYQAVAPRLRDVLWQCASARELNERGWQDDVTWCLDANVSQTVPVFDGRRFVDAAELPRPAR